MSVAAVLAWWPLVLTMTIRDRADGRIVFRARMSEGEEFILSFIHSVNRRPVHDTIRVNAEELVIVLSRYDSMGAGMPESFTMENGWMIHRVGRSVPEVGLFIGRVANHTIELRGRRLPMDKMARPGTAVVIRPEKASYYQVWSEGGFK